jgi:1,4-dihydroxy-2-naphthoate octaprenyltransferase
VRADGFSWPLLLLAGVGLLAAHTCNNLLNDLSDTDAGLDTASYPRAQYAPHPILSGMVRRRSVGLAVLGLMAVDLAVLVVIAVQRGWPVVAFALAGLLLSVAYATPPLRWKARALGELEVLLVWGPLMVAGTYFAASASCPGRCGWPASRTACCAPAC